MRLNVPNKCHLVTALVEVHFYRDRTYVDGWISGTRNPPIFAKYTGRKATALYFLVWTDGKVQATWSSGTEDVLLATNARKLKPLLVPNQEADTTRHWPRK